MGGPVLPAPAHEAIQGKAVTVMFERIQAAHSAGRGSRVQLVATAALTNVALLLALYPEVGRAQKAINRNVTLQQPSSYRAYDCRCSQWLM